MLSHELTFGLLLSRKATGRRALLGNLGRVQVRLTLLSLLHQFYRLFSRKMLYVETNHQHPRKTAFNLFLQCFLLIGIIPVTKHPGCFQFLGFVFDDMDSSKCDNTTKESGVLLWLNIILLDDAERCLVTLTDGIDFMTAQRTVEI